MEDIVRFDMRHVTRFRSGPGGERWIEAAQLRGWAVADEPLVAMEALLEGEVVGAAALGLSRPDIGLLFSHIDHAGQAGFEIRIDRGRLPPGCDDLLLRARTRSGRVFSLGVKLVLAQEGADPEMPPVRMHVERCGFDAEGALVVTGWALARAQLLTVQVYAEDDLLGAATTGLSRPDILAGFPAYPNAARAGFQARLELSPPHMAALATVRVEVLARDGTSRWMVLPVSAADGADLHLPAPPPFQARGSALEFQPQPAAQSPPPPPPPPGVQFHPDAALLLRTGELRLAGWAASPGGVERIIVEHEGQPVGEGRTGLPRPDVAQAFPHLPGAATAGFSFKLDLGGAVEGEQTFTVRLEAVDGPSAEFRLALMPTDPAEAPRDAAAGDAIMLAVDGMQIEGGHARRVITGAFHLVGWAVAVAAIAKVEVWLDDASVGQAYHGIRREDVGNAFAHIADALLGGYALSIPSRLLRNGRSRILVIATDREGATAELSFTLDVDKRVSATGVEALRRRMPYAEAASALRAIAALGEPPLCEFVLRVPPGRKGAAAALDTLRSLVTQSYPGWQAWLLPARRKGRAALLAEMHAALPEDAARIGLLEERGKGNAPGAVGLLQAGDVLAVDALLHLVQALHGPGGGELAYGDDRRAVPGGDIMAFFKPDWSPDLALSQNYIGRAWLARGALAGRLGLTLPALGAGGDYAAILALTAGAAGIRHVARVTLEAGGGNETPERERKALAAALARRGEAGEARAGAAPFLHRVARRPARVGSVSIIIPSIGAHGHVARCVDSIRRQTLACDPEIVIVDNLRGDALTDAQRGWKAWFREHADVVVPVDEPFNWSRLNNLGASAASGDYLLFLNDDVEVLHEDWLLTMMAEAERPEIGLVGPQLLYPDGKVQHAGMYLSRDDLGVGRHAFRFAAADEPGYFGLALSQREVSCVTGACMLVRREVFEAVGRFDEAHSVVNNDVDFCLRVGASGRRVIYTPHASLTHHELASRAGLKDDYDKEAFLSVWADYCQEGDPYHSPNLSSEAEDYVAEEEALREVHAGHPLGDRKRIRRILAVKLDHIGDLVTALPAFRRLKAHFPEARLTALVGKSTMGIAQMEGAIDELIPFEFFDARSGLGQKILAPEDYAALEARLHEGRFDLALDLRKLGDTRHILQHSGAPILAGFDHDRRFAWLDIALEWERDPLQANKRNHVADDLLNLVDSVANAFVEDRRTIQPRDGLPPFSDALEAEFGAFLRSEYVVVHPSSGTPLRQWAPDAFARLIDLLAERDGIPTALIGGPDERGIADAVLASVRRRDMVADLVGRSRLGEVPRIMAGALLFVGNNSGPSHIAAGLGVPTIGVHSAVIASEEWAPLGPDAVALRREMSCAPCYIINAQQCHRSMACLTRLSPFTVHALARRMLPLRRRLDATA